MAQDIVDSLRGEISETQKRREKLNTLKITFVTGFLGLGSIKLGGEGAATHQLLYLAPLAGLFFDLLILGEHFAIRRIGTFFRMKCKDDGEREWQEYVRKNRDKFFRYGSYGFTLLTFMAAVVLLWKTQGSLIGLDILWFGIVFSAFVVVALWGQHSLRELDTKYSRRSNE